MKKKELKPEVTKGPTGTERELAHHFTVRYSALFPNDEFIEMKFTAARTGDALRVAFAQGIYLSRVFWESDVYCEVKRRQNKIAHFVVYNSEDQ